MNSPAQCITPPSSAMPQFLASVFTWWMCLQMFLKIFVRTWFPVSWPVLTPFAQIELGFIWVNYYSLIKELFPDPTCKMASDSWRWILWAAISDPAVNNLWGRSVSGDVALRVLCRSRAVIPWRRVPVGIVGGAPVVMGEDWAFWPMFCVIFFFLPCSAFSPLLSRKMIPPSGLIWALSYS